MSNQLELRERLTVMELRVHLWSGERAMSKEDEAKTGIHINAHNRDVIKNASKRLVDPKYLRDFQALKTRIRRIGEHHGLRFLSARAYTDRQLDVAKAKLDAIIEEAEAKKADFIRNVDRYIMEWADKHPDLRHSILKSAPSAEALDEAIQFGYVTYKLAPAADTHEAAEELESHFSGLSHELLAEIGRMASERIKKLSEKTNRDSLQCTTKDVIQRLLDKMYAYSFLDHRIEPFYQHAQAILKSLPITGVIKGQQYIKVFGLLKMLANPDDVLAFSESLMPSKDNLDDPSMTEKTVVPISKPVGSQEPVPVQTGLYF